MFVKKSTYKALEIKYRIALQKRLEAENMVLDEHRLRLQIEDKFDYISDKWNRLVRRINKKGGEDFLDSEPLFNLDDVKRLLILCHPDKHNGKKSAEVMTVKLLKLKKSI